MRSVLVATIGLLSVLVLGCATTSRDDQETPTSKEPSLPMPDAGPKKDTEEEPEEEEEDKKPPPDCSIPAHAAVAEVDATFLTYGSPSAPPTMTGGALEGTYVVEKAVVFLPSNSAGLVDTSKSTGTISAWAVFKGTRYRLYLKAAFSIDSVFGVQSQGVDTESQGGYTASGGTLLLDHACDGALANEADYSFTSKGPDGATLLIKTTTPYGDTYLQLDATKK